MSKEQQKLVSEDCERIFEKMSEKLAGLANSSLLVTGGGGFMGSWVSELVHYMNRFQKMNIRLFILDRNLDKFENNLPHIAKSKYIEFSFETNTYSLEPLVILDKAGIYNLKNK